MELGDARRILLCLRYGIGDVVMETPVLEALRAAAPNATITALGAPPAIELLEGDARVDKRVSAARWALEHRWDEGSTDARAQVGDWVERRGFDVHLDVHHAVAGVRRAIWARGIRSYEADEEAEERAVRGGADGVAAIKVAVREGWGLDVPPSSSPRLELGAAERGAAERWLRRAGVAEHHRPIGISPVASLPMKRWPAGRLAALADRLIEDTGRPLLLFFGPQREAGAAVRAAMEREDRVVDIGALHLRRVAALLERCAVFVCNDTGLMHMAAAVGTETVGVFGPTSPHVYLPPAAHATGLGGVGIDCPHHNTDSLEPPGCWTSDHCLIAERSCVWGVEVGEALEAARTALGDSASPGTSPRRSHANV